MRGAATASTTVIAAVAAAALAVLAAATGALDPFELPLRDAMVRLLPPRAPTRVAAVVVDEASIAAVGAWPWPRARVAELVSAARAAGAAGVVVDVLLLEAREGDAELAAALATLPSVLAAALDDTGTRWLAPLPQLAAVARPAHAMFELDRDGVVRRVVATKQAGAESLPALAVAAAALADPTLATPVGRALAPGFRAAPGAIAEASAARVLRGEDRTTLGGRVVFIGLTAAGLGDRVVTPATRGPRPDPGVLVQAAVTEALLAGDLLRPLPPWLAAIPAAVIALAAAACSRLGGWRRLAAEVALLAAPLAAGALALAAVSIVAPTAALLAVALGAVLAVEIRIALLAWRLSGSTAALLAATGVTTAAAHAGSPERRLELVERLAAAAARRRVDEEESRREVAHELKTPLTSVRGLGQMLRDLDLPLDQRRRAAELLVTEADRLRVLIEHLTELERVTRRPLAEAAAAVDLGELARDRAEVHARGRGREVHADVAPGLAVAGDRLLLERAIDNLIGNALKFSPDGEPVCVRAYARGGDVVVEVADRGPGVAPAEREAIFRRFARGAAARGHEGMGLGLALVREVITWHGGRVEVGGAAGGGAVFVVTLPALAEDGAGGEHPGRR